MPHFDARGSRAAHAMLLAGYQTAPEGNYFLIHNSWGEAWGDAGYAWMHEATLMRNINAAYHVTATPAGPSPGPSPSPRPPPSPPKPAVTCPERTVPDTVTGACAPPCPDGSPRHGNVCPTAHQSCPRGFVNLFGMCVVAAPTQTGRDERTGIQFYCGAGGCTYVVPRGIAGCPAAKCQRACPSPKYLLAVHPNGATCVE